MLSYILVGLVVPVVVIVVWFVRDRAARWRAAEQRWESSCPEEIPPGQFHIVTFDDDVGSILNGAPNIHDTTVDSLDAAFRFLRDQCDDHDHSGYVFDSEHCLVMLRDSGGPIRRRPAWLAKEPRY